MKKLILILLLLLIPIWAWAAPFLVCDPQTGVTNYEVIVDGTANVVDARPDTTLGFDLGGLPVGTHNFLVSAIIISNTPGQGTWGQSDPVPFVGTRIQVLPASGLSVSDAPL